MEAITLDFKGMIDPWGYKSSEVRYMLSKHKDADVTYRVSSYGGDVSEALLISEAFADHGRVTVRFVGFNASAASFMAYGARRVEIADDGLWLCHRCLADVDIYKGMNLNDLIATIEQLKSQAKSQEAIDLMIAKKYHDAAIRNGKKSTVEDVLRLMNEERWLGAEEVVALGFVDGIFKNSKPITQDAADFLRVSAVSLHLPSLPSVERKEEGGALRKMLGFLGIGKKDAEPSAEEAPEAEPAPATEPTEAKPNNQKQFFMNEKIKNLLGLLAIDSLSASEEGTATLTAEQLERIDAKLAQATSDAAAISETAAILDGVSESVKSIDGLKNKVLAVVGILNRTPLTVPAGTGAVPEADAEQTRIDALKKHAVDPINAEAAAFAR